MKDMNDVVHFLERCTMFQWYRGCGFVSLDIYEDDHTADKRRVHRLYLHKGIKNISCEVTELSGWNETKQRWDNYIATSYTDDLSRRGEKKLRQYIEELAVRETGVTNPEVFTHVTKGNLP